MVRRGHRLTDPPEQLSLAERERLRTWCRMTYPQLSRDLARLWLGCRDWHLAEGVQRANWEAAFRMWVRNEDQFRRDRAKNKGTSRRPRVGSRELPQMSRNMSQQELMPLKDLLKGGDHESETSEDE